VSRLAVGRLEGDAVLVSDPAQASRLYAKGTVGTNLSGNALRLDRVEAAYAVETGRLEVEGHDLASLLRHGAAEVQYLTYRDLRERGLVVRPAGPDSYHVWARGEAPPRAEPWFTAYPHSERSPARVGALVDQGESILSIVDEDGGVTHYQLTPAHPTGDVAPGALAPATGHLLDDRVLVTDPDAATALRTEHLGTPHGDGLILSLTEAESLRRRDVLHLEGPPDWDGDLARHAAARQHHFVRTLPVYQALRSAGVVPKSGFRFGTHLRGYASDPDTVHAQWLLHCALPSDVLHWSELSRGVRLAHGVRKAFLLAVSTEGGVRFLRMAWFRP
jgi:tRNA-intron endonuclease, archaea type